MCTHNPDIYIFRGHIKLIDKFVVFGSFLMRIDLDKYKLDRCEILFTIIKMRYERMTKIIILENCDDDLKLLLCEKKKM